MFNIPSFFGFRTNAVGIFAAYAVRVAADGGVTESGSCVDAVGGISLDGSLLLIPSGYKAGKLYSQIPENGAGDLSFTRALDTATRVGSNGLIEKVRTNLVLQSQTFDNAGWTKANTTIVANAETAPDGTLTAETMTIVDQSSILGQNLTLGAGTYTISCFVKTISTTTAGTFRFNPVIDGVGGTFSFTPTSEYQRFSATFTAATGLTTVRIRGMAAEFVGTLAIWGFQVELSDFGPTPYIPTTTAAVSVGMLANVPRLDYTGGGCPKLLLEPQRTNLALFSEQFNNAFWNKQNGAITPNTQIAPDGTTSADTLTSDGGVVTANKSSVFKSSVVGSAAIHSRSLFMKKGNVRFGWFSMLNNSFSNANCFIFDFDDEVITFTNNISGTNIELKVEKYPNGWFRFIYVANSTGTTGITSNISFGMTNSPTTMEDHNNGDTIHLWGCQVELGSFPTSYIPTLAAAVTRSADAAFKTGISALIGQTEGTLFAEVNLNIQTDLGLNRRILMISGGNEVTSTYIRVNAANVIQLVSFNGGVQAVISSAASQSGQIKVAGAYKENDFVLYVNGVQIGTDTSGTIPATRGVFRVGNSDALSTAHNFNDRISQALLFPTRLTNAQLQELTTL